MLGDGLSIEEEGGADIGLREEIGSEGGQPLEDGETGRGLQHEECYGLLHEESHNHGGPRKDKIIKTANRLGERHKTYHSMWDRCFEDA